MRHDIISEQSILSLAIYDEAECIDIARSLITPEDFGVTNHRNLWRAICRIVDRGEAPDYTTVMVEAGLADTSTKPVYMARIRDLMYEVAPSLIPRYAASLRAHRQAREAATVLREALNKLQNDPIGDLPEIIAQTERELGEIGAKGREGGYRPIKDYAKACYERMERIYNGEEEAGLKTGLTELDKRWKFQRKELTVVAARPAMGKSALALAFALSGAHPKEGNKRTLVFSCEMSGIEIAGRAVAQWGKIDLSKIRDPSELSEHDWACVMSGMGQVGQACIDVDETPRINPSYIAAEIRRAKREGPLDLVIIDYLQLIEADKPSRSRERDVASITRELKITAKQLDVPIVVLAQLNRGVESRADKRPVMSDLRESGAVEQDADVILMLYRDEYYNVDSKYKGIVELLTRKARAGAAGVDFAAFNGPRAQISGLTEERAEAIARMLEEDRRAASEAQKGGKR